MASPFINQYYCRSPVPIHHLTVVHREVGGGGETEGMAVPSKERFLVPIHGPILLHLSAQCLYGEVKIDEYNFKELRNSHLLTSKTFGLSR
jgi:hypothetical protein